MKRLLLAGALLFPLISVQASDRLADCQGQLTLDILIVQELEHGLDPLEAYNDTDYYYEAVEIVEALNRSKYIHKKYNACLKGKGSLEAPFKIY